MQHVNQKNMRTLVVKSAKKIGMNRRNWVLITFINSDVSVLLKAKSKIFMIWRAWMIWILHRKKKGNRIAEYNLLQRTLNSSKLIKYVNSRYSPIIYGYMNKSRGRNKSNNFRIWLERGYSATTIMRRLIIKLENKENSVT